MSGFLGKVVHNVYAENQKFAVGGVTLYGGTDYSEHEVVQAYAESNEISQGFAAKVNMIAAECETKLAHLGEYGMVFYAEAEGGFFKRILDALIKVYNKAKDFIVKLLGRFKNDKKYREELANLESIAGSLKGVNFPDSASIAMNKTRYGVVTSIVVNCLKENGTIVSTEANGKTMKVVSKAATDAIDKLTKADAAGKDGENLTAVKSVGEGLGEFQKKYPTSDIWLRFGIYGVAAKESKIGDTYQQSSGDANFGETAPQSPAEAIGKLWSQETTTHKGGDIVTKVINGMFTPVVGALKYDTIAKALEDGVKMIDDMLSELKDAVNTLSKDANRIQTSTNDEDKAHKEKATSAANLATTYSTVLNNYSIVATTAFNTAKQQLDRLMSDMKSLGNKLDTLRKDKGNKDAKSGTGDGEQNPPADKTENK